MNNLINLKELYAGPDYDTIRGNRPSFNSVASRTRRIMTEYAKIVRALTLILLPISYSDFDNPFSSWL